MPYHRLWTSAPDGEVTYYNQGWYDYTGINGFEILKAKVWDIIHPDDRGSAAEEWLKVIQSGTPADTEQRLRRHDGEYRWHMSRLTAHKDEAGQTVLWVGTNTDIHEQKVARIEVAETNNELATINEELTALMSNRLQQMKNWLKPSAACNSW
jgi:PAS domain S-box-containing protein